MSTAVGVIVEALVQVLWVEQNVVGTHTIYQGTRIGIMFPLRTYAMETPFYVAKAQKMASFKPVHRYEYNLFKSDRLLKVLL